MAWQAEQGLPQNSVNPLLQDHDGYLWIGTFGGLARFDGERFSVFDSAGTPGFASNRILSLYESRSGVLWIGTFGRRSHPAGKRVATTYTPTTPTNTDRAGLPSGFISYIRGDAEWNVWIKSSRGVAKFAGAKLEAYPTHRGKAGQGVYLQSSANGPTLEPGAPRSWHGSKSISERPDRLTQVPDPGAR